jgi:hypothetical protein
MLFTEADVHTATTSLSNATATWAGWAVTAVTAKFYRSQSDTARPRPPLTGKTLTKPASLGMCIAKALEMKIDKTEKTSLLQFNKLFLVFIGLMHNKV